MHPTAAEPRVSVWRRLGLVIAALAIVVVAAACQVRTTVAIDVAKDGSGTVAVTCDLDKAAAGRMPDLDQSLLVADLGKAGWKVTGPKAVPGGGWQVSATKRFGDTKQLGEVVSEISGPNGPFHGFALTRSHGFAKTGFKLTGTVDLSQGIEAFGDPALRQALGGTMFGRTDQALTMEFGKPPAEAVRFRVVTRLPGGATREWNPRLGDPATTINASSASRSTTAWLFVLAALLAAAGFVGTVLLIARYNRLKAPPSFVHRPGGPRRPWETD